MVFLELLPIHNFLHEGLAPFLYSYLLRHRLVRVQHVNRELNEHRPWRGKAHYTSSSHLNNHTGAMPLANADETRKKVQRSPMFFK